MTLTERILKLAEFDKRIPKGDDRMTKADNPYLNKPADCICDLGFGWKCPIHKPKGDKENETVYTSKTDMDSLQKMQNEFNEGRMSKMSDGFFKDEDCDYTVRDHSDIGTKQSTVRKDIACISLATANRLLKERGLLAILDAAIRFHKTRANSAEHLSADRDLMNATGAYLETIEKADTAEGLLRELVKASIDTIIPNPRIWDVIGRAKKLLEQK